MQTITAVRAGPAEPAPRRSLGTPLPNIPDHVRAEFERVRPILERALSYGPRTHDADDVLAGIEAGAMQLWTAPASVCITEIVEFPRLRAVRALWAAGDLRELTETILPAVERFGRDHDCRAALLGGRFGWRRAMTRHGFRDYAVIMNKEI
ncbi:hypothetical protein [Azospirillum sp. TSO22-1]|uniref:hypothetical protein n=1 Tax=Azospirillum sp. TSO22-1 TaxID=716789 RepID=UPI000D608772|nr:hypothetical protein [Azospirillum sp. TSO22-1]PWC53617.1 hypothetical protein TSO221_10335 [Azospirillum sp. TSO22-1]